MIDIEHASTRRHDGLGIVYLLIGLYITLQTIALTITNVIYGITVVGAYVVVGLLLLYWLKMLYQWRCVKIPRPTLIVSICFGLFILWQAITGIWGPNPLRALTLVGISLFGGIIFITASTLLQSQSQLLTLNVLLYRCTVVLATVGLIGYVLILAGNETVSSLTTGQLSNWQLIAMPANGILYRFTGFVGDPHFYSWYAGLGLMAGIFSESNQRWRIGIAPIAITILLAMSRTYFVTLVVGIFVLVIIFHRHSSSRNILRSSAVIGATFGSFMLSVSVLYPATTLAWIHRRLFATLFNDPRFTEKWPTLIENIIQQPIIGYGSRSAETVLGTTAHNAYLGIWHDFGLIGLCLWLLMIGTMLVMTSRASQRNNAAIPWFFAVLTTIGINIMLSFQYDLFVWLIGGVALSTAVLQDNSVSTD